MGFVMAIVRHGRSLRPKDCLHPCYDSHVYIGGRTVSLGSVGESRWSSELFSAREGSGLPAVVN